MLDTQPNTRGYYISKKICKMGIKKINHCTAGKNFFARSAVVFSNTTPKTEVLVYKYTMQVHMHLT